MPTIPSDIPSRLARWKQRLRTRLMQIGLTGAVLVSAASLDAQEALRVGVLMDNPPYSYLGDDGQPQGFVVDLMAGIERHMGLRLERVVGGTPEITEDFREGRLDLLQSYAYFPSREDHAAFSNPYLSLSGSIFVRKDGPQPTKLEDLRGLKVLVHDGSLGHRLLLESGLGDSVVLVPSVVQSLRMLNDGVGDATLVSRLSGLATIHRYRLDRLKPSGEPLPNYAVEYCFAVRAGDRALLVQLNEGLAILQRTGEYDEIYRRWFGHLDPRRYTAVDVMGAIALGLAIAFIATLWFYVRQRGLHRRLAAQARALERSEQLHRGVFDASPEGLALFRCAADGSLLIEQANRAFARLLLRSDRLLPAGLALRDLLPAGHTLVDGLERAARGGGLAAGEHPLPPVDGAPRWVRASAAPVGDGLLLVLSDISGEKAAQDRLIERERQLRHSQKLEAIGTLASGIAHDFNNILTSIGGNTELVRLRLPSSHPLQQHLAEVTGATGRATALVRQILTFARKTESRREHLELSPLIEETCAFLRAAAPSSITFEHRRANPPLSIDGDPTQLHQVFMNLGTNAVQAIGDQPGRVVFAEERAPDGSACLAVTDNGPGMPPELLARIFEPFFTTKAPHRGTGLGLAVVHGIMEAHQGSVSVESFPNRGTTFRLRFPAPSRPAPPRELPEPPPPLAHGRGELLLVVDDERPITQFAASLLPRLGYRVSVHNHPVDALDAFRRQPEAFSLLLSDLTMPEMSGLELIGAVRSLRTDLPCILMTGFLGGDQLARSRDAGLAAILEKPLTSALLSATIARVLAGVRAARPTG